MIARTSIAAYHELRREGALGAKQRAALALVRRYPGRTAVELTQLAGLRDPNGVRPRLVELAREGYIEAASNRQCSITGRMAMTWRLAERKEQRELFGIYEDHD
jgi:predicted ArsR family transcriptional regulator